MYCERNFRTKKALKEAFTAGEKIVVYQPGGMFPGKETGRVSIEGPHYPEPHKWYANVDVEHYVITKIRG